MDLHARRQAILRELRLHGTVAVVDLAERHRVSEMTVRRDLAGLERDGELRRIHGGAETLDRPVSLNGQHRAPRRDSAASTTATDDGDLFTLGMVIPDAHFYFPQMKLGAAERARELGGRVFVEISGYDTARELRLIDGMLASGVHGLLVTTAELVAERTWDTLARAGVPVVLMERNPGLLPVGEVIESVSGDHAAGAAIAVRELVARGCTTIGAVLRRNATTPALLDGFRRQLADLPGVDGDMIVHQTPGDVEREGEAVTILRQAQERGVTGLLVHTDSLAIDLLTAARTLGVDVPGDLSIIAYEDQLAEFAEVPLTAVTPPRRDVGRNAVDLVMERVADTHGRVGPARHVMVRPSFRERRSTAPRTVA